MAKEFPIGTIRHWESGDVIKAHEPTRPFSTGWINLRTSPELENIGREADLLANSLLSFKLPINGEKFLDHEINEFRDEDGKKLFSADDFKKYEGFLGAGRYAFRNEFSRLFMHNIMRRKEQEQRALVDANEEAGGDKNNDKLTKEEKDAIRAEVRANFKEEENPFTVEKAQKLVEIIKRTGTQIREGLNFTDNEKAEIYDKFKKIADDLPQSYDLIEKKREQRGEAIALINKTFNDNWGVRESCKDYINANFDRYVKKYADQISKDSLASQMEEFGVSIDSPTDEFYNGIYSKIDEIKKKDREATLKNLEYFVGGSIDIYRKMWFDTDRKVSADLTKENGEFYIAIKGEPKERLFSKVDIGFTSTSSSGRKNWTLGKEYQAESTNFKDLIYLRFMKHYGKRVEGDWAIDHLPAIQNMENIINELPKGHFLSNDYLQIVTNNDYNGGSHGGYAWYNSGDRRINLSAECVNSGSIFGVLSNPTEFKSVMLHEIGHAVSKKFGRSENYDYRKFVVECGWTYTSKELRAGMTATGDQKAIPRTGSNSDVRLISDYSGMAPEEAFAEYYSFYGLNKDKIDKFLKTGDRRHIESETRIISASNQSPRTIKDTMRHRMADHDGELMRTFNRVWGGLSGRGVEMKMELVSPWETRLTTEEYLRTDAQKIKRFKDSSPLSSPPVIAYREDGKSVIFDGVSRLEVARMNKRMVSTIHITKEAYYQLKQTGISDKEIADCVYTKMRDKYPLAERPQKQQIAGLIFRDNLIPSEKILNNARVLKVMQEIFNSEELRKALEELFGSVDDFDIEKARKGRYKNNPENRRKHRVGLAYGKTSEKEDNKAEGKIVGHFDQLISITSGKQKEFFEFQRKNAKPVDVLKTKDVLTPSQIRSINRLDIIPKQCYVNAARVAQMIPGAKYVEGHVMIMDMIPIDHAWNELNGKYFDVTIDIALKGDSKMSDYTSILEFDNEKLNQYMVKTEKYGPYIGEVFKEQDDSIKKGQGVSRNMTMEEVATYHSVPVKKIAEQLELGIAIEMEHTTDREESMRIALDHLYEFPDYYTRLEIMEKQAEEGVPVHKIEIKKSGSGVLTIFTDVIEKARAGRYADTVKKAFLAGQISLEVFQKAIANVGEIRKWSDGSYRKVSQGKWVKINEKSGKEKEIAASGMKKKIQNERFNLETLFSEQKKKFEESLVIKFPKDTTQYKVFFQRAWEQEFANNDFLKKIREEQKELLQEIYEIIKRSELDKKAEREKLAGKQEIDFDDLNEDFNQFRNLFQSIEKSIPRWASPIEVAPQVTVHDYYLDTEASFKTVEEYKVDKSEAHVNNVSEKWEEMKRSGKYTLTHSPKSNSQYLVDEKSGDVFRMADHWGRCASCNWDVDFKQHNYGIAVCNVKDFTRKDGSSWFNPVYRTKIVEAANLILPKLNELVKSRDDIYLTEKAKERIRNFSKKIEYDYLTFSARLCEEEVKKLKQKYKDLFGDNFKKSLSNQISDRILESVLDEEDLLEKAKSGVYADTSENRRLKRVGQQYGSKKEEEQGKSKTKGEDKKKEINDYTDEDLADFAKESSDEELNRAATGANERLRVAAKKELERRKTEGSPEEEAGEAVTLETFKNLAKEAKDADDFMSKVHQIKNVPGSVSKEFFDKYGDGGNLSPKQASEKLIEEVKGSMETRESIESEIKRLRDIDTDDLDEIKEITEKIQKLTKDRKKIQETEIHLRKVEFEEYRKGFKDFSQLDEEEATQFYEDGVMDLNFTEEEYSSLNFYIDEGFEEIRDFIASGETFDDYDDIEGEISNISSFISKNKIKENLSLNRRVEGEGLGFFKGLKEGDVYEDASFSSTSLKELPIFGDFNIEILAKAGSPVANIHNKWELEYLIDKGSKFRVLKKSETGMIVELL